MPKPPRAPPGTHRALRHSASLRHRRYRLGTGSYRAPRRKRKRQRRALALPLCGEAAKMAGAEVSALPDSVLLYILELLPLRDRLRAARWDSPRYRQRY